MVVIVRAPLLAERICLFVVVRCRYVFFYIQRKFSVDPTKTKRLRVPIRSIKNNFIKRRFKIYYSCYIYIYFCSCVRGNFVHGGRCHEPKQKRRKRIKFEFFFCFLIKQNRSFLVVIPYYKISITFCR